MATGAALAGGNTEMVVGMAMKGAELTTDNEGLRSALSGQGDAMMLAGADRMASENAAQAQANAARARQNAPAGRLGSGAPESGGAIVVAQAAPPARPAHVEPRPVAAPVMPKVTYFSCMGVTKKTITTPERGRHDAYDTTYFGIITARGDVFSQDAVNLFRQHTGSRGVNNTEDVGTSCHPYQSRSEAQNATNGKISNDARGGWKQVTGIELSL